jgi:hypothetical protein
MTVVCSLSLLHHGAYHGPHYPGKDAVRLLDRAAAHAVAFSMAVAAARLRPRPWDFWACLAWVVGVYYGGLSFVPPPVGHAWHATTHLAGALGACALHRRLAAPAPLPTVPMQDIPALLVSPALRSFDLVQG